MCKKSHSLRVALLKNLLRPLNSKLFKIFYSLNKRETSKGHNGKNSEGHINASLPAVCTQHSSVCIGF